MRLLALALVVHLALIGRARADAPALQLEGELPFTEAELREALEPRLPDAQVPASSTVVVRGDGQFLIKHRAGAETHVISDWTPHAAIVQKREEAGESVQNVLSVAVAGDAATFSVNGQQVATLPRSQFDLDGQVGLRINHNLNLHVTDIGRPSF